MKRNSNRETRPPAPPMRNDQPIGGRCRRKPSIAEQVEVIDEQIRVLRLSFTDLGGATKGRIRDPKIRHEIRCLERTKDILEEIFPADYLKDLARRLRDSR